MSAQNPDVGCAAKFTHLRIYASQNSTRSDLGNSSVAALITIPILVSAEALIPMPITSYDLHIINISEYSASIREFLDFPVRSWSLLFSSWNFKKHMSENNLRTIISKKLLDHEKEKIVNPTKSDVSSGKHSADSGVDLFWPNLEAVNNKKYKLEFRITWTREDGADECRGDDEGIAVGAISGRKLSYSGSQRGCPPEKKWKRRRCDRPLSSSEENYTNQMKWKG
ncbi:hypothetical protein SESBI_28036 [Sesbania bispinosa]|nr:hypothetical protein SESBI_28036 [Sesbania bispinosa]